MPSPQIAFLARYDVTRPETYAPAETGICVSGHKMYLHFMAEGYGVLPISPLKRRFSLTSALLKQYYKRIHNQTYYHWSQEDCLRSYAKDAHFQLSLADHDVIFTAENVIPLARLQTNKPIVAWFDSMLAPQIDQYPYLSNLCSRTRQAVYRLERETLPKITKIIFSSEWAAEEAQRLYNVPDHKITVIPYGANIDFIPTKEEVHSAIRSKNYDTCRLLLLGVDFDRKGGKTAFEVAEKLYQQGLPIELTYAGCTPPEIVRNAPFVKTEGFIKKHEPEGRRRFRDLLLSNHFMILPSKADCSPTAHMEAHAFGLPSLATEVGGTATIVKPYKNGLLFDMDAPAEQWASQIQKAWTSRTDYQTFSKQTLAEYHGRLNWEVNCQKALEVIHSVV